MRSAILVLITSALSACALMPHPHDNTSKAAIPAKRAQATTADSPADTPAAVSRDFDFSL